MVLCMFNYMDVNYKTLGLCLVLILIKLYDFFFFWGGGDVKSLKHRTFPFQIFFLPPLLPEPHPACTADEQERLVHSSTQGCCSGFHDLVYHDSTKWNDPLEFK